MSETTHIYDPAEFRRVLALLGCTPDRWKRVLECAQQVSVRERAPDRGARARRLRRDPSNP